MSKRKTRALITGASRGLGAAISSHLKEAGVEVIAPVRADIDLSKPDTVDAYLKSFQGNIDILINNAGENIINPIEKIAMADWLRMFQINLHSAFILSQYFAPQMADKNYGRIVNITSCYGFRARAGRAAYSSTKAALDALTRSLALEFASKNVLCNSVSPGFIDTELTRKNNNPEQIAKLIEKIPMGRLGTPQEVAKVVTFLASNQNTYITGQNLVIDGGFTLQ